MAKQRKKRTRTVRPKIYIFCEGAKTEPSYFKAYINFKHPKKARLRGAENTINVEDNNKNTPVQLVDIAVEHKNKNCILNDQVWVVYDRESEQKYSDVLHKQAYDKARRNNIHVAISNVCFEYWLLLHLSNSAVAMTNCDSLIQSSVFINAFQGIGIKKYDKKGSSAREIAKLLMEDNYLKSARTNAIRNNQNAMLSAAVNTKEVYKIQPYTNVHELLDAIDDIANFK